MTDQHNLITCLVRIKPLAGRHDDALDARSRMLEEFDRLPGLESATLYSVEGTDEWRDIIVFSTQEAYDLSSTGDGYKEWSALTEFLGYEFIALVDKPR